jgi:hypothetical protein
VSPVHGRNGFHHQVFAYRAFLRTKFKIRFVNPTRTKTFDL